MIYNCPYCKKNVSEQCKAIEYDNCFHWYHLKCSNLTKQQFNYYSSVEDIWFCIFCRNCLFPFNTISYSELLKLSFNSNAACDCSKKLTKSNLENLSIYEVISSLSNQPNSNNSDC